MPPQKRPAPARMSALRVGCALALLGNGGRVVEGLLLRTSPATGSLRAGCGGLGRLDLSAPAAVRRSSCRRGNRRLRRGGRLVSGERGQSACGGVETRRNGDDCGFFWSDSSQRHTPALSHSLERCVFPSKSRIGYSTKGEGTLHLSKTHICALAGGFLLVPNSNRAASHHQYDYCLPSRYLYDMITGGGGIYRKTSGRSSINSRCIVHEGCCARKSWLQSFKLVGTAVVDGGRKVLE